MNEPSRRAAASPLARRKARELSLDLRSVAGSGPQGRVVLRDLSGAQPLDPASAGDALQDGARLRHRPQPMRFHDSVRAPLVVTTECDVGALIAMREQLNRSAAQCAIAVPAHITLNDVLVKAIALAARARTGKSVTIGIALGSASAPIVVADACTLALPLLSQEIRAARDAADAADHREDDHADVLVANFSAFGARDAEFPASTRYPIVLALGAAHQAVVVRQGRMEIATVLHATLCVGEGVLDAATAGSMLAAFRRYVESPAAMLV